MAAFDTSVFEPPDEPQIDTSQFSAPEPQVDTSAFAAPQPQRNERAAQMGYSDPAPGTVNLDELNVTPFAQSATQVYEPAVDTSAFSAPDQPAVSVQDTSGSDDGGGFDTSGFQSPDVASRNDVFDQSFVQSIAQDQINTWDDPRIVSDTPFGPERPDRGIGGWFEDRGDDLRRATQPIRMEADPNNFGQSVLAGAANQILSPINVAAGAWNAFNAPREGLRQFAGAGRDLSGVSDINPFEPITTRTNTVGQAGFGAGQELFRSFQQGGMEGVGQRIGQAWQRGAELGYSDNPLKDLGTSAVMDPTNALGALSIAGRVATLADKGQDAGQALRILGAADIAFDYPFRAVTGRVGTGPVVGGILGAMGGGLVGTTEDYQRRVQQLPPEWQTAATFSAPVVGMFLGALGGSVPLGAVGRAIGGRGTGQVAADAGQLVKSVGGVLRFAPEGAVAGVDGVRPARAGEFVRVDSRLATMGGAGNEADAMRSTYGIHQVIRSATGDDLTLTAPLLADLVTFAGRETPDQLAARAAKIASQGDKPGLGLSAELLSVPENQRGLGYISRALENKTRGMTREDRLDLFTRLINDDPDRFWGNVLGLTQTQIQKELGRGTPGIRTLTGQLAQLGRELPFNPDAQAAIAAKFKSMGKDGARLQTALNNYESTLARINNALDVGDWQKAVRDAKRVVEISRRAVAGLSDDAKPYAFDPALQRLNDNPFLSAATLSKQAMSAFLLTTPGYFVRNFLYTAPLTAMRTLIPNGDLASLIPSRLKSDIDVRFGTGAFDRRDPYLREMMTGEQGAVRSVDGVFQELGRYFGEKTPPMLRRPAQAALSAPGRTAIGAAAGFGFTDGDFGDRARNAALVGGVLGGGPALRRFVPIFRDDYWRTVNWGSAAKVNHDRMFVAERQAAYAALPGVTPQDALRLANRDLATKLLGKPDHWAVNGDVALLPVEMRDNLLKLAATTSPDQFLQRVADNFTKRAARDGVRLSLLPDMSPVALLPEGAPEFRGTKFTQGPEPTGGAPTSPLDRQPSLAFQGRGNSPDLPGVAQTAGKGVANTEGVTNAVQIPVTGVNNRLSGLIPDDVIQVTKQARQEGYTPADRRALSGLLQRVRAAEGMAQGDYSAHSAAVKQAAGEKLTKYELDILEGRTVPGTDPEPRRVYENIIAILQAESGLTKSGNTRKFYNLAAIENLIRTGNTQRLAETESYLRGYLSFLDDYEVLRLPKGKARTVPVVTVPKGSVATPNDAAGLQAYLDAANQAAAVRQARMAAAVDDVGQSRVTDIIAARNWENPQAYQGQAAQGPMATPLSADDVVPPAVPDPIRRTDRQPGTPFTRTDTGDLIPAEPVTPSRYTPWERQPEPVPSSGVVRPGETITVRGQTGTIREFSDGSSFGFFDADGKMIKTERPWRTVEAFEADTGLRLPPEYHIGADGRKVLLEQVRHDNMGNARANSVVSSRKDRIDQAIAAGYNTITPSKSGSRTVYELSNGNSGIVLSKKAEVDYARQLLGDNPQQPTLPTPIRPEPTSPVPQGRGSSLPEGGAKEPWQMTRDEWVSQPREMALPPRDMTLNEWRAANGYANPLDNQGRQSFPHGISNAQKRRNDAALAREQASQRAGEIEYEKLRATGQLPKVQDARSIRADGLDSDSQLAAARVYHKRQVAAALNAGESVPPEVLKEYPDLAAKFPQGGSGSPPSAPGMAAFQSAAPVGALAGSQLDPDEERRRMWMGLGAAGIAGFGAYRLFRGRATASVDDILRAAGDDIARAAATPTPRPTLPPEMMSVSMARLTPIMDELELSTMRLTRLLDEVSRNKVTVQSMADEVTSSIANAAPRLGDNVPLKTYFAYQTPDGTWALANMNTKTKLRTGLSEFDARRQVEWRENMPRRGPIGSQKADELSEGVRLAMLDEGKNPDIGPVRRNPNDPLNNPKVQQELERRDALARELRTAQDEVLGEAAIPQDAARRIAAQMPDLSNPGWKTADGRPYFGSDVTWNGTAYVTPDGQAVTFTNSFARYFDPPRQQQFIEDYYTGAYNRIATWLRSTQGGVEGSRPTRMLDPKTIREIDARVRDQANREALQHARHVMFGYDDRSVGQLALDMISPYSYFAMQALTQGARFYAKHPGQYAVLLDGINRWEAETRHLPASMKWTVYLYTDADGNEVRLNPLAVLAGPAGAGLSLITARPEVPGRAKDWIEEIADRSGLGGLHFPLEAGRNAIGRATGLKGGLLPADPNENRYQTSQGRIVSHLSAMGGNPIEPEGWLMEALSGNKRVGIDDYYAGLALQTMVRNGEVTEQQARAAILSNKEGKPDELWQRARVNGYRIQELPQGGLARFAGAPALVYGADRRASDETNTAYKKVLEGPDGQGGTSKDIRAFLEANPAQGVRSSLNDDPRQLRLAQATDAYYTERDAIEAKYQAALEDLSQQWQDGKITGKWWSDMRGNYYDQRKAELDALKARHPGADTDGTKFKALKETLETEKRANAWQPDPLTSFMRSVQPGGYRDPNEPLPVTPTRQAEAAQKALLSGYFDIRSDDPKYAKGDTVDYAAYKRDKDAYLAALTPEQRAYVLAETTKNQTEADRWYNAQIAPRMDQYFGMPEYTGGTPEQQARWKAADKVYGDASRKVYEANPTDGKTGDALNAIHTKAREAGIAALKAAGYTYDEYRIGQGYESQERKKVYASDDMRLLREFYGNSGPVTYTAPKARYSDSPSPEEAVKRDNAQDLYYQNRDTMNARSREARVIAQFGRELWDTVKKTALRSDGTPSFGGAGGSNVPGSSSTGRGQTSQTSNPGANGRASSSTSSRFTSTNTRRDSGMGRVDWDTDPVAKGIDGQPISVRTFWAEQDLLKQRGQDNDRRRQLALNWTALVNAGVKLTGNPPTYRTEEQQKAYEQYQSLMDTYGRLRDQNYEQASKFYRDNADRINALKAASEGRTYQPSTIFYPRDPFPRRSGGGSIRVPRQPLTRTSTFRQPATFETDLETQSLRNYFMGRQGVPSLAYIKRIRAKWNLGLPASLTDEQWVEQAKAMFIAQQAA